MTDTWKEREQKRFETGHYKPVPWQNEQWAKHKEHFVHVSRETADLLAYTQTPEKGERDLKTQIKPGKYLEKFYGTVLTRYNIADWAARYRAMFDATTVLHFAESGDEAMQAYKEVGSCMSFNGGGHSGKWHPALAYGNPDPAFVTVAYLKRGNAITARVLCNRQTKKYYERVYGDAVTLTAKLNALGWTESPQPLIGLRLNVLKHATDTMDKRPRFCVPAVDSHPYAEYDPEANSLTIIKEKGPTQKGRVPISLGYYSGLTS